MRTVQVLQGQVYLISVRDDVVDMVVVKDTYRKPKMSNLPLGNISARPVPCYIPTAAQVNIHSGLDDHHAI